MFDADDPRVRVWSDDRLSDDAHALLDNAPRHWVYGKPASIRLLADRGGMSYWRARKALAALVEHGYAATIPYGNRGRVQYVGVPMMIREVGAQCAAA